MTDRNERDALLALAERAIPFLRDEGAKYDDDGSNEPLELAREIEAALAAPAEGGQGFIPSPPDVLYTQGYVQGAYDFCNDYDSPAKEEVIEAANAAFGRDFPETAALIDSAGGAKGDSRERVLEMFLGRIFAAQRVGDDGEYKGWKISGRGSLNEVVAEARDYLNCPLTNTPQPAEGDGAVEDQPPHGFIKVRDAVRGVVSVNKVFPGDIIAEEYDTRPAAAVAVDGALMKVAMQAFWQSVEESGCTPPSWPLARDTLTPRWVRAALTAAIGSAGVQGASVEELLAVCRNLIRCANDPGLSQFIRENGIRKGDKRGSPWAEFCDIVREIGSAGGVEGVQATDHVRRLVGTLDEWRLRMSYSDSYVGEPQGLFKSTIESLARAVDPIYPPKQEPAHPLKGVCIHTSAGTFDESTPIEDLAQPRAERQEGEA